MPNKIAIYARVSTADGRQSADNQLNVLRGWALQVAAPGTPVIEEYVDEASGAKADRPEFKRLMASCLKRRCDVLLVWALDRLSREGIAKMAGYLATLRGCGVRVMSRQEPWLDTEGPMSELLVAIFSWVAQQERQRLCERVKAGLARTKAKGTILGRPRLKADFDSIRALRSDGKTLRQISASLGVSKTFVAKYLGMC